MQSEKKWFSSIFFFQGIGGGWSHLAVLSARSLDYFWQGLGDWYAVLEMEPWSADARQALACCPISPAPASIFMTLWFVCCV